LRRAVLGLVAMTCSSDSRNIERSVLDHKELAQEIRYMFVELRLCGSVDGRT
jgi:hypothetical protein